MEEALSVQDVGLYTPTRTSYSPLLATLLPRCYYSTSLVPSMKTVVVVIPPLIRSTVVSILGLRVTQSTRQLPPFVQRNLGSSILNNLSNTLLESISNS